MRWDDFRRSDNVEDDRGGGGGFDGGGFGGGFGIPGGGGGLGIGTMVVLGVIGWALGINPMILIGGAEILTGNRGGGSSYQQPYQQPTQQQQPQRRTGAPNDQAGQFVAAVLGNTEDTWGTIFQADGKQYRPPKLRLFDGQEQGGCGLARAATGPFYCPQDRRIYMDTSFFRDIRVRFRGCTGKACDFAQAYVIAHEVGHHVQNLLGTLTQATRAQQAASSKPEANRIQVRVELQADCYAGVWAFNSNARFKFLEPGDIEAALQTAAAIGDDRLQQQTRGAVVPDSFTHGTSAQRQRWFTAGFKEGKISACDTFKASSL